MLEELLNPEVKKNGVKQVAIPANKSTWPSSSNISIQTKWSK
jgi:hypothetical protein